MRRQKPRAHSWYIAELDSDSGSLASESSVLIATLFTFQKEKKWHLIKKRCLLRYNEQTGLELKGESLSRNLKEPAFSLWHFHSCALFCHLSSFLTDSGTFQAVSCFRARILAVPSTWNNLPKQCMAASHLSNIAWNVTFSERTSPMTLMQLPLKPNCHLFIPFAGTFHNLCLLFNVTVME